MSRILRFFAANTFILALASLLLIAGSVQAATILFPSGGGLGSNAAPTLGKIPVGTSGGVYAPTSTISGPITVTGTSTLATTTTSSLNGTVVVGTGGYPMTSAGITSAIQALGNASGTVLIRNGAVTMNNPIALSGKSNITIQCQSQATVFHVPEANLLNFGFTFMFTGDHTSTDVTIENCTLDGGYSKYGSYIANTVGGVVPGTRWTLINNQFKDFGYFGLWLGSDTFDTKILQNHFVGPGSGVDHIGGGGATNIEIAGNIWDSNIVGNAMDNTGGQYFDVHDNYNYSSHNIYFEAMHDVKAHDNHMPTGGSISALSDSGYSPAVVTNAHDISITNNTLGGGGSISYTAYASSTGPVLTNGGNVDIRGNHIASSSTYAILVGGVGGTASEWGNNINVSDNIIDNPNTASTTSVNLGYGIIDISGINITAGNNITVQGNTISDVTLAAQMLYGIEIGQTFSPSALSEPNHVTVANNRVTGYMMGEVNRVSSTYTNDYSSFLHSATSTQPFGINLKAGCFSINDICVGGSGSGTVGAGTQGQFPFYNASGATLTATSSIWITQSGQVEIPRDGGTFYTYFGNNGNTGIGTQNYQFVSSHNDSIGNTIVAQRNSSATGVDLTLQQLGAGTGLEIDESNALSAGTGTGLDIEHTGATGIGALINRTGNSASSVTALSISATNSGGGPAYSALFNAGNVGIGTTSPFALFSVQGNGYFSGKLTATSITATSTATVGALTVSTTTAGCLNTSSAGVVYAATCATSSAFPFTPQTLGNATSTLLLLNNGVIALASSTAGGGAQNTGLTISGGATTTGFLAITGTTGTTSVASGEGFTIGNTQFLLQQTSGDIGINTTPSAGIKLAMNGFAGSSAQVFLGNSGANTGVGTNDNQFNSSHSDGIGNTMIAQRSSTGSGIDLTVQQLGTGIGLQIQESNALGAGTNTGLDIQHTGASGVGLNINRTGNGTSINITASSTSNGIVFNSNGTLFPTLFLDLQKSGVSQFNVNSSGGAYFAGSTGIGTTSPATKLQVSSGASATTTVTVGELGLTSSKSCVNMNAADGSASSFYINAAHALVVEANYCR